MADVHWDKLELRMIVKMKRILIGDVNIGSVYKVVLLHLRV